MGLSTETTESGTAGSVGGVTSSTFAQVCLLVMQCVLLCVRPPCQPSCGPLSGKVCGDAWKPTFARPCAAAAAGTGAGTARQPLPFLAEKAAAGWRSTKVPALPPCPKPAQETAWWRQDAMGDTAVAQHSHPQRRNGCPGITSSAGARTPRTAIGSRARGLTPAVFAGALAHRSCAALQPRRRCDLQTHRPQSCWGRIAQTQSKPAQGPRALTSSASTSLQTTLNTRCAELRLLCSPGGSGPNPIWASSGQNTAVTL